MTSLRQNIYDFSTQLSLSLSLSLCACFASAHVGPYSNVILQVILSSTVCDAPRKFRQHLAQFKFLGFDHPESRIAGRMASYPLSGSQTQWNTFIKYQLFAGLNSFLPSKKTSYPPKSLLM